MNWKRLLVTFKTDGICLLLLSYIPLALSQEAAKIENCLARAPFGNEAHLENEPAVIEKMIKLVLQKIRNDKEKNANKNIFKRDAHPKSHGLYKATFTLSEELPEVLKSNPFFQNSGQAYESLVRYSNARSQNDKDGDLRGMAVKIFGVGGKKHKMGESDIKIMDLVTINDNKFPARTSEDFMKLMDHSLNGTFGVFGWLFNGSLLPWKWRFHELSIIKNATKKGKEDASLADLAFHSQLNFAATDDSIIRFAFVPKNNLPKAVRPNEKDMSENYFREELVNRLDPVHGHPVVYDLQVQIRPKNEVSQGEIEDATAELSPEKTPFISIGQLIIHPQELTKEMDEMGENISFNPWRSSLRPLGSVGRSRELAYEESLKMRRQENGVQVDKEPESFEEARKVLMKDHTR